MSETTTPDLNLRVIGIVDIVHEMRSVSLAEKMVETDIYPLVATMNASPEQVERWWRAIDPLNQTFEQELQNAEKGGHKEVHAIENGLFQRSAAALKGATTLLASTIHPELFEPEAQGWQKRLAGLSQREEQAEQSDAGYLATLMQLIPEFANKTGFSLEDLERLSLAREMYLSSTILLARNHQNGRVRFGDIDDASVGDFFRSHEVISNLLFTRLTDCIYLEDGTADTESLKVIDEARMLGLYNRTLQVAHVEGYSDVVRAKDLNLDLTGTLEQRREALGVLLADLRHIFIDDKDSGIKQRLRPIKGQLHEILWFLDTTMMKHMDPKKYDPITVWPSFHSSDRPEVGHPRHKRGYDFVVQKQGVTDYVQVKSAPQDNKRHKKLYHPIIWQYEETNFKELQPKRLQAKIRAYSEIYERGFDPKDVALLDQFLMETPRKAMESIHARARDRSWQMRKIMAEHKVLNMFGEVSTMPVTGVNRAARRAAERANRRKR